MTQRDSSMIDIGFDEALDAALTEALLAPALPTDFRTRLRAALARAGGTESIDTYRARLELEHRDGLAALKRDYLRLRRRTLGTLLGELLALTAAVALVFPWLNATVGTYAVAAAALFGGVGGASIGIDASRERPGSSKSS